MSLSIYKTHVMLAAIQQILFRSTFLRDRYFPTNDAADIFPTEDVLVEYRDGNKKMAPCVMPRKKGITIARDGYRTMRYTPPYVAPQRSLTIDDLNQRGFGENLFSTMTPEQREANILKQDLIEFDTMISSREEYIAAQCMLNNGYVLKHYADSYGGTKFEEFEIRFYEGESNPGIYTPDTDWDATGADIFGDIEAMIKMLTSKGLPATDLLVAPDVAATILSDTKFQKFMDIKNMNLGSVNPVALPSGAASLAKINVYGRPIEIFVYDETYEDETTGTLTQYIPAGTVVLTAPAAGRGLYGAVTQVEQSDLLRHTYAARRIPKHTVDVESDTRTLRLASRPLLIPQNSTPWIKAKVQ